MLEKIMTILSLFPAIVTAVKSVEAAIPGTGHGKTKLDMILQTILAVSDSAKDLIPIITSVIGVIVTGLNAVGVFKK